MKVKIKKLKDHTILPCYASNDAAGLDLTANDMEIDFDNNIITYKTNIAFEIPNGYVGLVFPRSSVCKKNLTLCNSVGVIDSDYRGDILLKFRYIGRKPNFIDKLKLLFSVSQFEYENIYHVGDRVGQIIIMKRSKIELDIVDELSDTERGNGGFGSTDKQ